MYIYIYIFIIIIIHIRIHNRWIHGPGPGYRPRPRPQPASGRGGKGKGGKGKKRAKGGADSGDRPKIPPESLTGDYLVVKRAVSLFARLKNLLMRAQMFAISNLEVGLPIYPFWSQDSIIDGNIFRENYCLEKTITYQLSLEDYKTLITAKYRTSTS